MLTLLQIAAFKPFEPQVLLLLLLVVLLLMASAAMSGSETALFSLSPTDMERVKKSNSSADLAIMKLLGTQDYMLATVLITNNLVNIFIILLSSNFIDKIVAFNSGVWEMVFKTVIVTFVLLLFGEIMPKIYAAYNPLRFARMVSRPLLLLKTILKPLSFVLVKSGKMGGDRFAGKKGQLSIDDLSDAIEMTKDHTEEERQMLSGIVNFVSRDVSAIMKLRVDIVAVDKTAGFDEVKRTIIESGFSRIPVYEDNIDTVVGILYVKDMMPFIGQTDDFNWQAHLRAPYFVPENKKINDLMEEFQTQKVHVAIVVDEYGATQGLVSLEDILEEIVGEITDESDNKQPTFYKRINENTYIFDGKTHLTDFCRVMGVGDDYLKDFDAVVETLAGLLLELKRDFIKKDETITSGNFRFTVTALDGRRIDKVKVVVLDSK